MFCEFDTAWFVEKKYPSLQNNLAEFLRQEKQTRRTPVRGGRAGDSRIWRNNSIANQLQLGLGHALSVAERGKMADALGYFN